MRRTAADGTRLRFRDRSRHGAGAFVEADVDAGIAEAHNVRPAVAGEVGGEAVVLALAPAHVEAEVGDAELR